MPYRKNIAPQRIITTEKQPSVTELVKTILASDKDSWVQLSQPVLGDPTNEMMRKDPNNPEKGTGLVLNIYGHLHYVSYPLTGAWFETSSANRIETTFWQRWWKLQGFYRSVFWHRQHKKDLLKNSKKQSVSKEARKKAQERLPDLLKSFPE